MLSLDEKNLSYYEAYSQIEQIIAMIPFLENVHFDIALITRHNHL